MNVNLTPYWEQYVREKVESGRYNNASEVIREALRKLEYVEGVQEFRSYATEALDPANADKLIKAAPGYAVERMQRIIAGERPAGPIPDYLVPTDDDGSPWFPDEDVATSSTRKVAEDSATYSADEGAGR